MPETHNFSVTKTTRYALSQSLDGDYERVCFALHGYGQLVPWFIRPFREKALQRVLYVAPEGLHRFYLQGTSGRVGASWMTREARLSDIADYCRYLDALRQYLEPHFAGRPVGVLGFSQGVATACRWLTFSEMPFEFLISYAGLFPPDLPLERALPKMQQIPVRIVVGDEDAYAQKGRYEDQLEDFRKQGFPVHLKRFAGEHKVYAAVLREIMQELFPAT